MLDAQNFINVAFFYKPFAFRYMIIHITLNNHERQCKCTIGIITIIIACFGLSNQHSGFVPCDRSLNPDNAL